MRSSMYREHLLAIIDWYTSEYGLHPQREANINQIKSYVLDVPDDELLNELLLDYCQNHVHVPYSFFYHRPSYSRLSRCVRMAVDHYKKNHNYSQYWHDLQELDVRVGKVEDFISSLVSKGFFTQGLSRSLFSS